ncbi:MAG: hypothetical protein KatS3mg099_070 [Candidatus Parcubacteria bacterium]|nr:MAG: hypothetical protein KatS3mg099_070 [Candidatus Parcubacteria bacterium]
MVVAFTKIDKPNADVERAKYSLLEHGIYLEGLGGDIPYAAVSSKTGEGIEDLLELVLLVADMQDIRTDPEGPARGLVVEAHHDEKRGISATLLVKEGTLRQGEFVVAGGAWAPVRRLESPFGGELPEAGPSCPAVVRGFSSLPRVGAPFRVFQEKNAALSAAQEEEREIRKAREAALKPPEGEGEGEGPRKMPVIVKADAVGSLEALLTEIPTLATNRYAPVVVHSGIGAVSESDIQRACATAPSAIVLGFCVGVEPVAQDLARREGVFVGTHRVIYEALEWLSRTLEQHTPKRKVRRILGAFKVLAHFSSKQDEHLIGGVVTKGVVRKGARFVKPLPDDAPEDAPEPPVGAVLSLQRNRKDVQEVPQPEEFGAMVQLSLLPQKGNVFEVFVEEWE